MKSRSAMPQPGAYQLSRCAVRSLGLFLVLLLWGPLAICQAQPQMITITVIVIKGYHREEGQMTKLIRWPVEATINFDGKDYPIVQTEEDDPQIRVPASYTPKLFKITVKDRPDAKLQKVVTTNNSGIWEADENGTVRVKLLSRGVIHVVFDRPDDPGTKPKEESLETVVQRVLRKLSPARPPIATRPPRPTSPGYTPVRWSPGSAPSPFLLGSTSSSCGPGDPATPNHLFQPIAYGEDACKELQLRPLSAEESREITPDLEFILRASEQEPVELGKILLKFLYNPQENKAVYGLVMGGQRGQSVIFNNLSRKLRPNDKLLRYLRGRQRYCNQKSQDEWNRWMANRKFVSQIALLVVDLVLADLGIFAPPTGTPLGYIDVNIKLQQAARDTEIKKSLNGDIMQLIVDTVTNIPELPTKPVPTLGAASTVKTGPLWEYDAMEEYMTNIAKGVGPAAGSEAYDRWTSVRATTLSDVTETRLEAARTEGDWLDCMDKERQRMGEEFLWHRSVVARFNAIFAANQWPFDPTKYDPAVPLNRLFFGDRWKSLRKYEYNQYAEARSEVVRRMDEARERIILTAFYGGLTDYEQSAPGP